MERNINRQGVDVSQIKVGDTIAYQCGNGVSTYLTDVTGLRTGRGTVETLAGTIAKDYILAIIPKYKPPKTYDYQSPYDVAQIVLARLAGKPIYRRNKIPDNDDWELCTGNFQFNFVAGEYRVGEP